MKFALHLALALTLNGIAVCGWAFAGDSNDLEYQIKATYLYKFASYIEWPVQSFAQADTPVTIGILGADEVGEALSNLTARRPAGARTVAVKLLTAAEPSGEVLRESLRGVQILFIGRRENGKLKKLLESLQAPALLIVTEASGALGAGSMINFVPVDEHIRFEVSLLHAERSGLKISARLLEVAQKIETRRP